MNSWMRYRRDEEDEYKFNHYRLYNYSYNSIYFHQFYRCKRFSDYLIKRGNDEKTFT